MQRSVIVLLGQFKVRVGLWHRWIGRHHIGSRIGVHARTGCGLVWSGLDGSGLDWAVVWLVWAAGSKFIDRDRFTGKLYALPFQVEMPCCQLGGDASSP